MGYIGYIPSFWMSETWSFAGPDIHLQFAGAESSAEAWHFDWSSPDRLSSRRVHGVMTGKENTELPVQEGGLCVSFGRCNFWALTSQSFSTCLTIQILSWEQWSPEAKDAHPKPGHSNIGAAVLLQVFAPQAFQMLNLDELVPVK